jgi:hypothetical protein
LKIEFFQVQEESAKAGRRNIGQWRRIWAIFSVHGLKEGRTDSRNLLRRFREVLRIVRSCRGARGYREKVRRV